MATTRKTSAGDDNGGQIGRITLRRLDEDEIEVEIRGMSPYIAHRFSEEARRGLGGHPTQEGLRQKKGVHNPEQEARDNTYWMADGVTPGMPATAIKAAMVGACRLFEGVTMTALKTIVYIVGETVGTEQLIPIQGTRVLREDWARPTKGGPYLLYRHMFVDWSATVRIRFLPSVISKDSVVALLHAAGRGGVGDWRPSSPKSATGTYGTWEVVTEAEEQPTSQEAVA